MKANITKHENQYINLRTGGMLSSRRDCVKGLVGLAGILATGQAPAAFVRSMLGARGMAFGGGAAKQKERYFSFASASIQYQFPSIGSVSADAVRVTMRATSDAFQYLFRTGYAGFNNGVTMDGRIVATGAASVTKTAVFVGGDWFTLYAKLASTVKVNGEETNPSVTCFIVSSHVAYIGTGNSYGFCGDVKSIDYMNGDAVVRTYLPSPDLTFVPNDGSAAISHTGSGTPVYCEI